MSLCLEVAIDRAEFVQESRPASGALGEALHIILLVRRMDAVVIEREADQQRVHAKPRAERLDDWNGSAAADDGRFLTPFLLERLRSRLEDGSRRVEADRGRASFAGVSDGAIGREPLGDEVMQTVEDMGWLLIGHEPEGKLGGGARRDDCLDAGAGIAAEDAVDLRGWPRPELLDHTHALFAGGRRQSNSAEEGGDVEIERAPLRELGEVR